MSLPTLAQTKKKILEFKLFPQVGEILPSNTWLLHFCTEPQAILEQGFLYGEELIHRLECTWKQYGEPRKHEGPGYNFAFLAEDPDGAGARWDEYKWPSAGNFFTWRAILFQAPGIPTSHHDGFEQVIFRGSDANFSQAKILEFEELEDEGRLVKVYSPTKELLDEGLTEDTPEETINKWINNTP